MEFINIYNAKTNLSKYIDMIDKDKEVVICKNGIPVAQLVKYRSSNVKTIGILQNKITINENFDDDLPEEIIKYYK